MEKKIDYENNELKGIIEYDQDIFVDENYEKYKIKEI